MRATASRRKQTKKAFPTLCYHGFALFIIFAVITWLGFFEQNYFNQDENFIQFGPIIIGGFRSLFDHGIFPFWTPYGYMGAEVFQTGLYSFTYPPLSAAYAFARWFVGDEAFWPTAYFAIHAVAGYAVMNYLLKGLKVSLPLRTAAAISFIFIGYNLIAGRSWYFMMPVMVWLPAIFLSIVYRSQWTRRNWILITGFCIAAFYHAGNMQMWCYGMMFWIIAWAYMLYGTAGQRKKLVLDTALAALLTLAIILPLLLPQLALLQTVLRQLHDGDFGSITLGSLGALIFPYPLGQADNPHGYKGDSWKWQEYAGHVYYGSAFFIPLVCLVLVAWPTLKAKTARQLFQGQGIWLAMALIAFLCGLGSYGLLWKLMMHLPEFDKFSNPFKFLPFLHFFMILCGAVFAERLIAFLPQQKRPIMENGALIICALLVLYSASVAKSAFWHWADRTYPPPPAELVAELSPEYRSAALVPNRSSAPNYLWTMALNFPSIYSDYTFGFGGYDQITSQLPETQPLIKSFASGDKSLLPEFGVRDIIEWDGNSHFNVSHLLKAKPLAFYRDSIKPIPVHVDWQGITLGDEKTIMPAGTMVLNFLFHPGFHETSGAISIGTDDYNRMILSLPSSAKAIRISYFPPYLKAGIVSGILLAVLFAMLMYVNRKVLSLKN